jgi:hypothetical protein
LRNTNNLPNASATGQLTTSNLGFLVIQGDHYKNPYYLAWNLGVERELPGANKLEVDYIANHGTNLFGRSNPNAPSSVHRDQRLHCIVDGALRPGSCTRALPKHGNSGQRHF